MDNLNPEDNLNLVDNLVDSLIHRGNFDSVGNLVRVDSFDLVGRLDNLVQMDKLDLVGTLNNLDNFGSLKTFDQLDYY